MLARPRARRCSASTSAPTRRRATLAEREGVEIRYYAIIYDLVDDMKGDVRACWRRRSARTFLGNAEILEVFDISKVGKVAGCRVTEGKVAARRARSG